MVHSVENENMDQSEEYMREMKPGVCDMSEHPLPKNEIYQIG